MAQGLSEEGIPARWRNALAKRQLIESMAGRLRERAAGGNGGSQS